MVLRATAAAALLLACAPSVEAQAPAAPQPIVRADVTGSVGWLAVAKDASSEFEVNRWHHSLFGAAGAGWYWTDHHKTEVDIGVGQAAESFTGQPVTIDGVRTFVTTESQFSRRTLGISQQYQFFRNAWFHPHVAAGALVTWERITDRISPVVIFDRPGPGRELRPGRTEGPRTEVTVRPFLATGFKAYMNRRGFFRSDIRVGFRGGADDVLVRFGFGIDF
jgi:hypothetical protein